MNQRIRHHRRGSAVLDAALVFPVLLGLTFGCVEFGHYFFIKHTLQGAAREGASAAAAPGSVDNDVTTAITQSMNAAGISAANWTRYIQDTTTPTPNNISVNQPAGTAIVVKVECTWGTVGLRPMRLIGASKKVVGSTSMRKEG